MPAGSYRFMVGDISCVVLSDGYFSCPTQWLFPNAAAGELAQALDRRHLPRERVLSPYACLLIQSGRNVILVDTGAGESSSTTGAICARLEGEGIRPRDIDTVILTHAHADHIGGTVGPRGRPVFENARHVLAEAEWEYWTAVTDWLGPGVHQETHAKMRGIAKRCFAALRFQLETVSGESEIAPGVRLLPAPGHTPGHMAVLLEACGERLLALGDAAVHPLHLEHPEWENGFDLQRDVAAATRQALSTRADSEKLHVMAYHFPFPSVGRVHTLPGGGWDWVPGW